MVTTTTLLIDAFSMLGFMAGEPGPTSLASCYPDQTTRGIQGSNAMRRRHLLLGLTLPPASPALGQDLPRSIRLVVPFAAGASSDTLARLISARLAELLGAGIVVDNRAGAGGLIAAQTVARAAPDGSTLLWGGSTAIIHAVMGCDPGYDVLCDFTPIATIVEHPALLAVRIAAPWQDYRALFAAARGAPAGALRYGSGGVGTPAHMAAAAMLKAIGVEGTHVPYRGANQATLAAETGEVDFAFAISKIVMPRMLQGAVRVLLSTAARRIPALPEVPTLRQAVPDGPVIVSGSSLVGPAGMPPALVARIHRAVNRIVTDDAALREVLTREGGDITLSETPAAYAAEWPQEVARMRRLVEVSGARME
ncbi:tripartite tricarboxylate transporter substrate binding protein [Paracraurococcus lichenis]|uniref:Tripartite tricarboxylate transporter substrate binding protein n=1 Tax=Paracraurococcus lichenis TaxID=3064888 RepID=A0ABT9ECD5_9PROT|nr:tripartite tricarboxylate transporter substrate binding protein [Paracraurococcus sp. LOR1-02]MDO9713868.1 tripartite tricarboxylate transporter substrate binding protein [Paracraurococcus sp. LOR1-02]